MRGPLPWLKPAVFVANDNGSNARKVGQGSNPRVSPDGRTVVFYRAGAGMHILEYTG